MAEASEGVVASSNAEVEKAGKLEAENAADPAEDVDAKLDERLATLFKKLNIEKIVLVDDKAEREVDPAAVIRAAMDNADATAAVVQFFPGVSFTSANENLLAEVAKAFNGFAPERKQELGRALVPYSDDAAEREKLNQLSVLAPEGVEVSLLTPHAWHSQRADLIAQCTGDRRTFFLFDQQLEVDDPDLPFARGSDIIMDIALQDKAGFGARWYCGMLSHTVEIGNEVATWQALAQEQGVGLQFFMPIAKDSLGDRPAFYGSIYRALINTYCESMKTLATAAFKSAFSDALEIFAGVDPIDFEHAVVKSSEEEGVSELETLARIFGIIQTDKIKGHILKEATLPDFITAARSAREVANIARGLPDGAKGRLFKLREAELYEPADLVNGHHDPLSNGDIFEIGPAGSTKLWVLIAQPCDLMVRPGGERVREDNFKVAVLAPIKKRELGKPAELKSGLGFELQHFDHEGAQSAVVQFPDATPADLKVLDLAVLDKLGRCQIGPDFEEPVLAGEAWAERVNFLKSHYGKVNKTIEATRNDHKDIVAKLIAEATIPRVAPGKPLKKYGAYEGGKFTYEIVRRGRIREPLAGSLLTAFSRYLARDAYGHDYSRERGVASL